MESMEEEWEELSNLLSQLHKKMEYAANTIRWVLFLFFLSSLDNMGNV